MFIFIAMIILLQKYDHHNVDVNMVQSGTLVVIMIKLMIMIRTQEVDSTYWNISKFAKPSIQIAGPKNIQENDDNNDNDHNKWWCEYGAKWCSLSRGDIASERGENWVTKYCKLESHNLWKRKFNGKCQTEKKCKKTRSLGMGYSSSWTRSLGALLHALQALPKIQKKILKIWFRKIHLFILKIVLQLLSPSVLCVLKRFPNPPPPQWFPSLHYLVTHFYPE